MAVFIDFKGTWSGGGAVVCRNLAYAAELNRATFTASRFGATAVLVPRNTTKVPQRQTTILLPQNAWPWSGVPGHASMHAKYLALRVLSELSMYTAAGILRIGSSIPAHGRVLNDKLLCNVLDREFEEALEESHSWGGPQWHDKFLLVGSLVPYRNVKTVIEALSLMPGVQRLHLTDNTSRHMPDANNKVHLSLGQLTRPQLLHAMREAPAVIFPSLVEASPVALLEAQAVGARIVASSIPGHQEVTMGDASIEWFPPTDRRALANALMVAQQCSTSLPDALATQDARAEQRYDWARLLVKALAAA